MGAIRHAAFGALLFVALPAWAQSHRGSLGLTTAAGFEAVSLATPNTTGESGFRVPLELGATLALFTHTELRLSGRFSAPVNVSGWGLSFYGGIRNSFGPAEWKTFFDVDLAVHALPVFVAGLRVGFGVQYDFSPVVGVYAALSAQLGGGFGLRLSGDVSVGLQFRTYLFE